MRRLGGAAGSLIVASCILSACGGGGQDQDQALRKGSVELGSIDEVVSATGTVLPQERVDLSFEQTGVVEQVLVEVGSQVHAGERLASLDTRSADIAVRRAEIGLQVQQLAYVRLFEPATEAQIAAAQAALYSASAAYEKQAQGADPEQVRIAQLQYEQAYTAYLQADIDLRGYQAWAPPGIVDQYRARFGAAISNLEIARLKLEQARAGPDQHALAAAGAAVAQAKAQLDRLREGPSELEAARAQAQLNQAQVALERARRQRDEATLVAPFTGVIAAVNVRAGMLPPSNAPSIVIIDAAYLHVEVAVDELDVGKLVPGQSALITLDALPSQSIPGQLTSIAPTATRDAAVVTYTARIDIAVGDLPVRSGMTATADIVVQRLENVLLVPNWAVRFDRATGQAYASVLVDENTLQEVPVLLGMRGADESQVIAGLAEGEVVAVNLTERISDLFGEGETE